jgi:cell division protease FtsH
MQLPGVDPFHKISIVPRGIGALGYTMQRPIEDRFLMDRAELECKLAALLGGRAAEALVFPSVSTGAADDLEKATDIARSMVARFGMTPELGQVAYEASANPLLGQIPEGLRPGRWYSDATAARIDAAVQQIIATAFSRARGILLANRGLLDEVARELLAQETIAGTALSEMSSRVVREVALASVA